jgi:Transcriptional regulatory protein, C terminal
MARRISFGVYELDCNAMELRRRGVLIRLQEQPFRVLLMLAERPGEIVTREEIQEKIWGKTFPCRAASRFPRRAGRPNGFVCVARRVVFPPTVLWFFSEVRSG